jgi:hypothetical protein
MENAIYAFLGGLILDFAILIEAGRGPKLKRPDFGDWYVWLWLVGYPLIGSIIAGLYGIKHPLSEIQAGYIGLSAPSIVKAIASGNLSELQKITG